VLAACLDLVQSLGFSVHFSHEMSVLFVVGVFVLFCVNVFLLCLLFCCLSWRSMRFNMMAMVSFQELDPAGL